MSEYRIQFRCPREYENEVWPKHFGESLLPRIGEMVRAQSGFNLYVMNVVHSEEPPGPSSDHRHLVEIILDYGRPK